MEPNNFVYGGVRLNLAGREPRGCVQPNEVEPVCEQLRNDLLALVNVVTGGSVIRRVERSDRWYHRSSTDTLPDLFIDWQRTTPIETIWSPKIGLVHAPYTKQRGSSSRRIAPRVRPRHSDGHSAFSIDTEDFGPSIAARLGVNFNDVDGRPVAWLNGRH